MIVWYVAAPWSLGLVNSGSSLIRVGEELNLGPMAAIEGTYRVINTHITGPIQVI